MFNQEDQLPALSILTLWKAHSPLCCWKVQQAESVSDRVRTFPLPVAAHWPICCQVTADFCQLCPSPFYSLNQEPHEGKWMPRSRSESRWKAVGVFLQICLICLSLAEEQLCPTWRMVAALSDHHYCPELLFSQYVWLAAPNWTNQTAIHSHKYHAR